MSAANTGHSPTILDASFAFGFTDLASAPPSTATEIAFAGRSNVGKSSLLNTLMSRKALVRTSSTPGCTRQINVFSVRVQNESPVHLVDLPGFGYAKRSKTERRQWGIMLERYFRDRAALDLMVILIDARRDPEELETELVEYLSIVRTPPVPHIFVATKMDKLQRSCAKSTLDSISRQIAGRVIGFSANTGSGRDELWRFLLGAVRANETAADHA